MSETNAKSLTPVNAYNLLVQLAKLPELKLSLSDHMSVQQALSIIKPLVDATLTATPEASTV